MPEALVVYESVFGDSERIARAIADGLSSGLTTHVVAAGEAPKPYAPVPFFWSDQFDSRIQYVGRGAGANDEEVRIVAGDPSGPFVALYGHRGRLRGALGVSMPRLVMPYRKLLAERATWDRALEHASGVT